MMKSELFNLYSDVAKHLRFVELMMSTYPKNKFNYCTRCGHQPKQLCDCTCYTIRAETKGTLYSAKGGERQE
jgi:hypothetical protein